MLFWFFVAALLVGLIYWRQGFLVVLKVTAVGFIAGVAGGKLGGWL